MSDYSKGGRGKKAPYQTVHYRIPIPIKLAVETLAEQYRQLIIAQSVDEANRMLERVQDVILENKVVNKKVGTKLNKSDLEQIVSVLQESLKLKANAGGKIKERVKQAISILEKQSG